MKTLIVVDIQNDFMPGGALAVPRGDEIIPLVNQLMQRFDHVIATQDYHPANHGSFASQHAHHQPGDIIDLHGLTQVLWPDHCIQDQTGANFTDSLQTEHFDAIVQKGGDITVDSYSGFSDNGEKNPTELHRLLQEKNVNPLCLWCRNRLLCQI